MQSTTSSESVVLDPTAAAFGPSDTVESLGRTHFIGIGGAGMSVLAEMLHERGVEVSGSDREANAKTERLESLGVNVLFGQCEQNVEGAHTVVYSSAIKSDNPEIVAAAKGGARIVHRSDILALLMASKCSISVAGAHGKTTTSSLITHILVNAGEEADTHAGAVGIRLADPSYAIGGSIQGADGVAIDGGHAGSGDVLVAEADESDGSFEKYRPQFALITNAEADHLDHYGDAEHYRRAFVEYAAHAERHLIMSVDDGGARSVIRAFPKDVMSKTVCYTTQPTRDIAQIIGQGAGEADAYSMGEVWSNGVGPQLVRILSETESVESGMEHFTIELPAGFAGYDKTRRIPVTLRVPGIHNVRNATAGIVTAVLLGMDPELAASAASTFRGASRRFEVNGVRDGVTVVDDYAHHPTEIAALLDAARRRYPDGAIRVLFQPHLFSRTEFFADRFAAALAKADDVVIAPIYPARERQEDFPGITSQIIVDAAEAVNHCPQRDWIGASTDLREGAETLVHHAQPGDILITVGAGDVTTMDGVMLEMLKRRAEEVL
ncbi:UDP-N-acetylmuramate--alanine ligase [Bifidobacterium commune]|uniref:UDP-N-acetylmuramate--L-alanine ligase n=1 Tax=Bifidobacterium commune TaxID=1505727 RepID=A0A1C4H0Y3_9BIFI|nr:UDP-N-acetylmuramate--alanine ligase [Bifidobacterium commune]SCC78240.1 UDP-N-acetylmuramate--L-alanine ligase [Bifidobacterium commune]